MLPSLPAGFLFRNQNWHSPEREIALLLSRSALVGQGAERTINMRYHRNMPQKLIVFSLLVAAAIFLCQSTAVAQTCLQICQMNFQRCSAACGHSATCIQGCVNSEASCSSHCLRVASAPGNPLASGNTFAQSDSCPGDGVFPQTLHTYSGEDRGLVPQELPFQPLITKSILPGDSSL